MKSGCIAALLFCSVTAQPQLPKAGVPPLTLNKRNALSAGAAAPVREPPRAPQEAAAPARRSAAQSSRERRERSMIDSLKHVGERGAEVMGCVTGCRGGPERQPWRVCIERCLDNPLLRSMFLSMLPDDAPDS
eukprot:CAMPEP_0204527200 /NCGR_PEP_ID=MMETSP0661-20131031/8848_1 /ASSEMBLY_ACC=CAM_ASM_000606 /TAXON_ID=109239 /ORGANISM="Alexandrium margalefi, Strain AMGDE01CS-322" /LENGTH=132 /DNA_ID=CAMNT_0051533085 /DNA_START=102 /DNA_END=497 /DNA_ORIENTATION=+